MTHSDSISIAPMPLKKAEGMMVKVCGMRDPDNIRAVEAIGIDLMGFIFFPPSSRHVATLPSYMPSQCKRVGVFVNAPIDDIVQKVSEFGFHFVQLHGDEYPAYTRQLRESLPKSVGIIKMIQISSDDDVSKTKQYAGLADCFLFETKCSGYGGSGQQFDWSVLAQYHEQTPFMITGGIGPDDVERIKSFRHPQFAGIDLNSRFETSPAMKDAELLQQFINTIRL